MGLLDSIKKKQAERKGQQLKAFKKTSLSFSQRLRSLAFFPVTDPRFYEELLIVLLEADVGLTTADKIIAGLKIRVDKYITVDFGFLTELLFEEIYELYQKSEAEGFRSNDEGVNIILMVGVNGTGKTTTIAKLTNHLQQQGKTVLVAAADTFRAGATQQLLTWMKRVDTRTILGKENQDPASVVVDACKVAKQENYDYLIVDTAGRLQNKVNLMNELAKIKRVAEKQLKEGVVNSYLVIDATTGQNGLTQAQVFLDNCDVNGIILTKVDGTSKGGIVLAIKELLNIDVVYVGSGESIDDFAPFNIEDFIGDLTEGLTL